MPIRSTPTDVVVLIERFLDGSVGPYDWDDFESVPITDPILEAIRRRCAEIPVQFPSSDRHKFASPEGLAALRQIANELRRSAPEVDAAQRRAHQVAVLAKSLYAGLISPQAFLERIDSEDYENPYVSDLLDRIEHEPARGRLFGVSAATHDRYVLELQNIIARVLSETADAAV